MTDPEPEPRKDRNRPSRKRPLIIEKAPPELSFDAVKWKPLATPIQNQNGASAITHKGKMAVEGLPHRVYKLSDQSYGIGELLMT